MIRVLEVSGSLKIGGQEKVAADIIKYADKDEFKIDYLVYDNENSLNVETVIKNGGRIIRATKLFNNRVAIVKKLAKIIKENGPYDIVHSHGMLNNGYVMKAAKIAGVKCRIAHAHSTNYGRSDKSIAYFIYKRLMLFYIKKYSTTFAACGQAAGEFLFGKQLFQNKGIVFTNRIDVEKFVYSKDKSCELKKQLGIVADYVFLLVGHIVPLKNHMLAFKAFTKFLHKRDGQLIVLGDGETKEKLQQYVEANNLCNKIIFKGNVNNVFDYMVAADCLLMPSLYEGFPVTAIEAQAADMKCILSSNISREVDIMNSIIWCNPYDEEDWEEQMCFVANNRKERKNNYSVIKQKGYDIADYKQWLTQFYKGLI